MVNKSFHSPAVVSGFPALWGGVLPEATMVKDDDVLDLEHQGHDLVIHAMALHWANDPVGQLVQCRRSLAPDGLCIAVMFGGQTLSELRIALAEAEVQVTGGLSPRVAPMAEIRDLGALIQRAGLALPVADSDVVTVEYRDVFHLMHDLRAMGETNVLANRLRHPTRRAVFDLANEIYAARFSTPSGRLLATFEFITLTGWGPDPSQQQPLRPGSAKARLADALSVPESKLQD